MPSEEDNKMATQALSKASNICLADIRAAHGRIRPFVHRTPILTSTTFNNLSGKELFFKCEIFQKTGSFKSRGATNATLLAKEGNPNLPGIVTHSSGNHGQAVAWAAVQVGKLPCSVVVPESTPAAKQDAIKGYGADLVLCENTPTSRKETCAKIAEEKGFHTIHPYDDDNVLAGQATIGVELHEDVDGGPLDAVLIPVSGGGLSSGIALATKALNPSCKIILVEAKGKELQPCLVSGERLWPNPPKFIDTIAEGIMTQQCGIKTFPILCDLAEKEVITIDDSEMTRAMELVGERMKLVIEAAAGAPAAAAFLSPQLDEKFPGLKRVGVILCGGNIGKKHPLI